MQRMKLSELLTYSFDRNVGLLDRVFRIVSGALLAIAPWTSMLSPPAWASILLSVAGIAWQITGVVSRCGMYYMFGRSTLKSEN